MSFFFFFKQKTAYYVRISDWSSDVFASDLRDRGRSRKAQDTDQAGARFQIDPHGLCHDQGIRSHASPAQRTGSPLVPAARHQGRGAPCGESFWHWALGADGGRGHAQPPFRSSRLIGAERQPTSDCRQSLQQSHGTYLQILDVNSNDGSIKSFNQELRLATDARSSFRWVVGANYDHSRVRDDAEVNSAVATSSYVTTQI